MKRLIVLVFLFCANFSCHKKKMSPNRDDFFSFHLFSEPLHLNPSQLRGSSASYLFQNLLRGLYRFDEKKGLVEEGGKCQWINPFRLQCEIINQYWSNGDVVTSHDYIRSFINLVDPKNASPRADILSRIKNADKILKGELKSEKLGIKAIKENLIEFEFAMPDSEFLYKLTSTALVPIHKDNLFSKENYKNYLTNGPYQISSWAFGKEIILTPNSFFKTGHPKRPKVKIYFIEDEMTAFRLYKNNQLSFLRRVPAKLVESIKNKDELYFMPMARFDYIGFGKTLMEDKNLRLALAHSIDYEELKKLLHALGRPGCPSLPSGWVENPPCYLFDQMLAKKYFKQINPKLIKKKFKIKVSHLGGEDIKQQAEFYQNQWKKNIGIIFEINQVEQKVFLNELQNNPPDVFRKGVGLDWPTCLNALETFSSSGKQNYIGWKNKEYNKIISKMYSEQNPKAYSILCQKALLLLINEAVIIPLGEMHFTFLASPRFTGWSLNSMNQLDLSQLHPLLKE